MLDQARAKQAAGDANRCRDICEYSLNDSPGKQISLTAPAARSMMTRGNGIVGYNLQTTVDTQHHLIVAHKVTNVGSDRD